MLVLSRKKNERIIVRLRTGEEIVFTTVRIGPQSVRLGIDAPDDAIIIRDELLRLPTPARALAGSEKS